MMLLCTLSGHIPVLLLGVRAMGRKLGAYDMIRGIEEVLVR